MTIMWTVLGALALLAIIADRMAAMRRREDVETLLMFRHPMCLFGHDLKTSDWNGENAGLWYTDCVRCRYQKFRIERDPLRR